MKRPTVSICVPAYNAAPYITQAIESALTQSFRDLEVVVIDNASTDDTLHVAQSYVDGDDRLRVLGNESNIGSIGNFERCVDVAQGEWIKFLCADDWLEPDCIQRMLEAGRPGVLVMNCVENYVFESGMSDSDKELHRKYWLAHSCLLSKRFPTTEFIPATEFAEFMAEDPTMNGISLNSAMIHRLAFQQFGRFNRDLLTLDDWELFARVAIHTGIVNLRQPLTNFRIHSASYGTTTNAKRPFKMNVVSPLLIRHEVAFSPLYAPVRNAAGKLKINLRHKLFEAARDARHAAHSYSTRANPDVHALDDWKQTLKRYPRLRSASAGYYLAKAWRRASKLLQRMAANSEAAL